jgi:hypothetical protein
MNILDIDRDIGNPQMCASYVVAIYSNLMASEVGYAFFLDNGKRVLAFAASSYSLVITNVQTVPQEKGKTKSLDDTRY